MLNDLFVKMKNYFKNKFPFLDFQFLELRRFSRLVENERRLLICWFESRGDSARLMESYVSETLLDSSLDRSLSVLYSLSDEGPRLMK